MTETWLANRETVERMRVRCVATDPLNVKLRLSSLFQSVDLRPSNLPPGAILKVRRFADPLPGRIRVSGYAMFPPEDWRRAATAAINEIARTAVRPYRTIVPAGAQAVVFQDEAEVLACMARECVSGPPSAPVWWAAPTAPADFKAAVVRRLIEAPGLIPAMFEYLAGSAEFAAWVRNLEAIELRSLAEATIDAFALPAVWRDVTPEVFESRSVAQAVDQIDAGQLESWFAWAPEAETAEFSRPERFFVAFVLTLQRAPAAARSPAFAEAVQAWVADAPRQVMATRTPEPLASGDGPGDPAQAATSEPPGETAMPEPPGEAVTTAPPSSPADIAPPPTSAPPPLQFARATPHARDVRAPVRTALGGLFYLINYALYAGFYGDFTQPRHPGLPLPVWDFIELLGRALLGDEVQEDRVWGLLAELSGREEGEPAGARFDPPEGLDRWVATIAEAARERLSLALQLDHAAGLTQILLWRPASIYAGPANVDVVFALADLPIEIRYAGLDRDPGWVPAAGRTIAFHFE
jgi:hypothetical protein